MSRAHLGSAGADPSGEESLEEHGLRPSSVLTPRMAMRGWSWILTS